MKNYIVTGMGCAACQARVENAVAKIPEVESVSVSLLTNSMNVEGEATDEVIIKAVEEAGYGIKRSEENSVDSITTVKESIEDNESDLFIKRLKLSLAFLLILMYITMGHNMLKFPIPEILEKNHIALAFVQMALALTVMVINKAFFVNGFKTLFTGHPNMDTLVALGSSISFAWSLFSIYEMTIVKTNADLMDIYHNQLYFESAAMIPALITVGKLLESISKGKTTDALKNLVKMAPKDACVERDGEILKVDISEVNVGDIVVIKPGDAIPVDGSVVNGESTVDESLLTGESVAVKVSIGDNVHATTINLSGDIKVKVTHVGEETAFSKIVKLVKEASGSKAPIARVADKVSGIFVPAVILIALVVLVIWIALGESVAYAIERAVCVLVISCPCALGLATPVAIMVGTGKGAKNGILFKSGESLENVCRADIVVLDKTGTVTEPASNVIKEDSAYAVKELKNLGLEVIMLSGDKEEAANAIAKEVGINEVIAGVLPDGKEAVVREVMKRGKVVMVGDGINDAPALVRADVGIAIGNGTDVAIDSADIVVMNSHLTDVLKSMRLSKRVLRTIHENLFWAFAYNVLLIPLAAGIYSGIQMNPMWGALAMSLSSFTVCMNALRINRYKL